MKCKICGSRLHSWKRKLFDDRHGYPDTFRVDKCSKCGFGQTNPQLSAKKISEIYSKYYPWKKTDVSKIKETDFRKPGNFTIWRKGLFINGQYLVKPKTKVLDVGCGLGYSLLELKSIGCNAFGIDPDPNALKMAKKFRLKFKQAFITQNPFPGEKFDYVIANQVLEHTNNPAEFLKACKKRLAKDGKIILSFPNTNSLTRYLLDFNWLHWHIPYHLNFFTKESFRQLTNQAGLNIVSLKTVTPNMWSNLQFRRLLQKPSIGKRDDFWDGKTDKTGINKVPFLAKIINFLENYNLLNRLIDALGLGESFVVILST